MYESVLGIWVILAPVRYGFSCTARGTTQSSSDRFTKTSCEIYSWFPKQLLAHSPAHLALASLGSPCPVPSMMDDVLLIMKKQQEREDQELSSELNWIFRHYSLSSLSFLALAILSPCLVITYDWERMFVHRDTSAQLPGLLQKYLLLLCDLFMQKEILECSKKNFPTWQSSAV